MSLGNAQVAELLLSAADGEDKEHRRTALQRAARSAMFRWPEEAAALVASGRSLVELPSVGPWLARMLYGWLASEHAPEAQDPPLIRRGFLTMAEARATLEASPGWVAGLRSDLQMHTTYSDGRGTLRDMAGACGQIGYEHVNITDHSKGLRIARGMDEERLASQTQEIALLNAELERDGIGLRILQGIEMNLSPEGEGDMEPDSLAPLALVLGAFHSKLRLTEDQTDRYRRALENRTIHVLAHPRGRRYGVRAGLAADWPAVFGEAAGRGVAMEIDAFPDRQDLDIELLRLAGEAGVWISVGTDAHSPEELRHMDFGLAAAIRAEIPRERILNFLSIDDLMAWRESSPH